MIIYLWQRMLKWIWDHRRELDTEPTYRISLGSRDNGIESICLPDPVSFKIQAVQGGTLIETQWYDHTQDETIRRLHIVTADENLAEAIGKIATMELLKR